MKKVVLLSSLVALFCVSVSSAAFAYEPYRAHYGWDHNVGNHYGWFRPDAHEWWEHHERNEAFGRRLAHDRYEDRRLAYRAEEARERARYRPSFWSRF
jgi:hypothetical protein